MQLIKKHKITIILALIVAVSATIRLFRLDSAPNGMLIDEPAFGYNAYSILKTGHDEHGIFFPAVFQSYGDDKLPLSIYAIVPSVAVFGLNHFSIRLPGVIFSLITLVLFFRLLKELNFSTKTNLVTTTILALVPWSFMISRFTRESSLALTLLLTSLIFLIKSIKNPDTKKYALLSGIFCVLTWYTYIAYRFSTILFFTIFLLIAFTKKLVTRQQISTFAIVFIIGILPTFLNSSKIGTVRLSQLGLSADPGPVMEITEKRNFCALQMPLALCNIAINKGTFYPRILLTRYLQAFSPELLFTKGIPDLLIFSLPNYGQLFLISAPLFLLGIIALAQKLPQLTKIFIITGLTTMVIPSVIAGEFHLMRLSPALPFYLLVIAMGIQALFDKYKHHYLVSLVILLPLLLQATLFYHEFFTVHIAKNDILYNTAHQKLMNYLQNQPSNTPIFFQKFTADPIIFYAFYTALDPRIYQKEMIWDKREDKGYIHGKQLRNIKLEDDSVQSLACKNTNEQSLYVTDKTLDTATPTFSAKSANGVFSYSNVYKLQEIKAKTNCPPMAAVPL